MNPPDEAPSLSAASNGPLVNGFRRSSRSVTAEALRPERRADATEAVTVNEGTVKEVDERLRQSYGVSRLGNKEDPLDELIFIVLSNKSREEIYFATFDALKVRFPSWDEAANATPEEIAEPIKFGGLADKKARTIKLLLSTIVASDLIPSPRDSLHIQVDYLFDALGLGRSGRPVAYEQPVEYGVGKQRAHEHAGRSVGIHIADHPLGASTL
jgi:hypothetical protein